MYRLREALVAYSCALKIEANNSEIHYDCGIVLQQLNSNNEALNSFNHAIENGLNSFEVHYHCGTLLLKLNRLKEAVKSFNAALLSSPNNVELHKLRRKAILKMFIQTLFIIVRYCYNSKLFFPFIIVLSIVGLFLACLWKL
ncbi:hypothetical protein RCL1_009053 [Eukaryota sp. TZLM3-RCL]